MSFQNTRTKKHAGICTVILTMLMTSPTLLKAETINYGSLQELFEEPVTSSATGKPQKSSEAPVALEIITAEKIRRSGVTSLPELLNRLPGMVSWQATRSYADVGVRGQNTTYNPTLLVLLNGRQVYIDSYGYTDWSLIPAQLEEIRQIEVVKGPTTALYGFNAVSGVVNIVTYNPQYDHVSEAGISGGTDDYRRAYGYKTFKLSDQAHIRISGSTERFDEFDDGSNTTFAASSFFRNGNNDKVMADGVFALTDKTELRVEGSYAKAKGTDIPVGYLGAPAKKSLWSVKSSLSSETDIGLIDTTFYTNHSLTNYDGYLDGAEPNNQITVLQLQDLFKIGTNHTFRLQGEYRHNVSESGFFMGPGTEVAYDIVAAGGMWNWVIVPSLEWTNAVRVDHLRLERDGPFPVGALYTNNSEFNNKITDYSLNSGIVWKATARDTLRASYGRGIQAPSLVQFGLEVAIAPGVALIGSPHLDPVIVNNYEIGYDRLIEAIHGKARTSLFYKKTEDINAFNAASFLSNNTFLFQVAEIGDSETTGIELGLEGKIGAHLDWDISYIYQTTQDDFTPYASSIPLNESVHYQDTVPHHVVKAHVGYTKNAWEADLYGEAASSFDTLMARGLFFDSQKIDGYYTLGGRIGYNFQHDVTLALHGVDLTQASVASNYGLRNERRVFLSLSKKF